MTTKSLELLIQSGWSDIDTMSRKAIQENWFPEAAEMGPLAYVKARLRQMANKKDPKTGLPLMGSISAINEVNGRSKRLYKQIPLFEIEDYMEVCRYHKGRVNHHTKIAKAYIDDCQKRFGVQLHIDLDIAV